MEKMLEHLQYLKNKQHTSKSHMGQKSLKGNFKIFLTKLKWKYNLSRCSKAIFRQKIIALNAYIRKLETSKINYLSFQLKKLEKEEKFELKISSNKAIRIRVENKNCK